MFDILPMEYAKIIEVIEVVRAVGCGEPECLPGCSKRLITDYYTREGRLLVSFDPVGDILNETT